jgi:DNA-binding LacI/PurR family transcriptional regulator
MPDTRPVIVAPNFRNAFASALLPILQFRMPNANVFPITDDPIRQQANLAGIIKRIWPSALIAISVRPTNDVIDIFRTVRTPIVLIDEQAPGAATVATDNFAGGKIAGKHLIERGYRSIAIVTGKIHAPGGMNAEKRYAGFREALADAGLFPGAHVQVWDYSKSEGEDLFQWLDFADAVFCAAGDTCATGIMTAARRANRPFMYRDPSASFGIVGFDDAHIAGVVDLTTVAQPLQAIAEKVFELAVTKRDATLAEPQTVLLEPKLIIRGTTCPVCPAVDPAARRSFG